MEYIEKTLGQVLRERAQAQPDHDFIIYADRDLHFTYGEFDKRVDDLAKGFLAMGLKKGDHIGLWATNVPDWNTILFASARLGLVFVIDTAGAEPLVTVLNVQNILREDVVKKIVTRDELLSGAPEEYGGYFQVPKTLE